MSYSLFFHEDARFDIKEAKEWYKNQKPGLEKKFSNAVKTTLAALSEDPFTFAIRYKNIRIAHTKTFPYGIHFYVDDNNHQTVIVAIFHNKRQPNIGATRA